jgi:putative transposase
VIARSSITPAAYVERFFNKLKHFRAIATRYDKLASNFLAGIHLASAIILLN